MKVETDAARMLVYRAGYLKDTGQPNSTETSIAKLYATEAADPVRQHRDPGPRRLGLRRRPSGGALLSRRARHHPVRGHLPDPEADHRARPHRRSTRSSPRDPTRTRPPSPRRRRGRDDGRRDRAARLRGRACGRSCTTPTPTRSSAALTRIQRQLDREVEPGADGRRRRRSGPSSICAPAPSLADFADCELVIEAAPERIELKHQLFGRLSEIVSADCVLASNTSSLLVTALAPAPPPTPSAWWGCTSSTRRR